MRIQRRLSSAGLAENLASLGFRVRRLIAEWNALANSSALKAAWKPQQEFTFREEVVPNISLRECFRHFPGVVPIWEINPSPSLPEALDLCCFSRSHSSTLGFR